MSPAGLHWIRSKQRALARAVLALFCLVWLQTALVPCAMAIAPDHGASAAEEHCPYCPPAVADGQDTAGHGTAACTYPDKAQTDTRLAAAAFLTVPALPVVAVLAPVVDLGPGVVADQARPPAPASTPLAVSYCRYLK